MSAPKSEIWQPKDLVNYNADGSQGVFLYPAVTSDMPKPEIAFGLHVLKAGLMANNHVTPASQRSLISRAADAFAGIAAQRAEEEERQRR